MASVKYHVLSCLKAFDVLSVIISTAEAGGDSDDHDALDEKQLELLSLATVKDQIARFKIWAGNIGAHRKGRSSLDYRLREASHIRAQIVRLLGDLWDGLQDATSILREERTPWDKEPAPQDELTSDEYVEEAGTTELDQISGDISEVIDCLFRLSVSIRNPAPHDRFKRSMWTDTTSQAHFYVAHVRERFKNADEILASRLGRANAHRRQYFRYREQHHEKLARGIDEAHLTRADDAITETIASSIPQQMKVAGLVGEGRQAQEVIDEDKASTGWTATTIASSLVGGDRDRPRILPLPKDATDRPFECPYCYTVISATTTLAWRRHVFADLCPYICLSPDCHTPEETYHGRHEWMQHMLHHHWRTWTCALGCKKKCFESATSARNHLVEAHSDVSTPEDLESLAGIHEGVKSRDATVDCPLCEESNLTIKEYARHVGRHQKDLALFALPPLEEDNDSIDLELNQDSGQSSVDMEDRGHEALDDDDDDDDDGYIDVVDQASEVSIEDHIINQSDETIDNNDDVIDDNGIESQGIEPSSEDMEDEEEAEFREAVANSDPYHPGGAGNYDDDDNGIESQGIEPSSEDMEDEEEAEFREAVANSDPYHPGGAGNYDDDDDDDVHIDIVNQGSDPSIDEMKQQLELFKREQQRKDAMEQQRELELKIRRDTEVQLRANMEEMRRQQEGAKAELEQAKLEAEKTALDKLKMERVQQAKRDNIRNAQRDERWDMNADTGDDDDRRETPAERAARQTIPDKLRAKKEDWERLAGREAREKERESIEKALAKEMERDALLSNDPAAFKSLSHFASHFATSGTTTTTTGKEKHPAEAKPEGRRGANRFGTELDLDWAIEQSAREHKEKEDRESRAQKEKYRSNKKAVIPKLWEPPEEVKQRDMSPPISQEQLVAEVKEIYAGLVMVENKCVEVDTGGLTGDPKADPSFDLD